jgi:hypothetical protein
MHNREHSNSALQAHEINVFMEIQIADYFEDHTKHRNTICRGDGIV